MDNQTTMTEGTTLLRQLQLTELEILLEMDRVCKANGIRYMLSSGTLLGAIRHKGFIPWDDDIDVMMPIADYNRFTKCTRKQLSSDYFLQTFETDHFHCFYAKLRKNNTTMREKNKPENGSHTGVWIDIFPIIGVKDDPAWRKKQKNKMEIYKRLYFKSASQLSWNKLSFDKKLLRLIPRPIRTTALRALHKRLFVDPFSCAFCCYLWGEETIEPRFKSALFTETCEVSFEGCQFPAPKEWDTYLTVEYGDYMTPPPEDKRTGGEHTISEIDLSRGDVK